MKGSREETRWADWRDGDGLHEGGALPYLECDVGRAIFLPTTLVVTVTSSVSISVEETTQAHGRHSFTGVHHHRPHLLVLLRPPQAVLRVETDSEDLIHTTNYGFSLLRVLPRVINRNGSDGLVR